MYAFINVQNMHSSVDIYQLNYNNNTDSVTDKMWSIV